MFGTIAMVGASLLAKGAANNAANQQMIQQHAQQAGANMYATMAARLNGQDALNAVQKDIANLAQQKVQQDLQIQMSTDQQKAQATVAAAAAGVEGGSVDAVHQSMESNEALALRNVETSYEDQQHNMAVAAGNAFNQVQTPLKRASAPVMKSTISMGDAIGAAGALYGAYENASLADIGKGSTGASLSGVNLGSGFDLAWDQAFNAGFRGRDFAKDPLRI